MKAGRLTYALAQRSGRERLLLLVLGLVVVPLAVVFLLVLPMLDAREMARTQAQEARATLDWVADQVRQLPAEDAEVVVSFGAGRDPIGISGIEDSLVRADLRDMVAGLSNRGDGGVDLTLEAVPFAALGDWLVTMVPVWGYGIASFRIETETPGLVNAAFELEAPK